MKEKKDLYKRQKANYHKMKSKGLTTLTVWVDADLKLKLKLLSEENGRSIKDIVTGYVSRGLAGDVKTLKNKDLSLEIKRLKAIIAEAEIILIDAVGLDKGDLEESIELKALGFKDV